MRSAGYSITTVLLAAALAAPAAEAQSITRLIPEAADIGDLVILEGGNFTGAQDVEFFAVVGGFAGTRTITVRAQSVSATRVTVQVPFVNSFAPPNAVPPGDPLGTLRLLPSAAFPGTATVPFYFMEADYGAVTTAGTGTTQPGGIGKPAVGFTIAGGPPVTGNRAFTATVGNALPGTLGILVIGFPDTPPYQMQGDGTVVVDLNLPLATQLLGIGTLGDAQRNVPIPNRQLGTTFMLQWAVFDPVALGIFVSNGLQFDL